MSEKTKASAANKIPARERLIFALDVPDLDQARRIIDTLGDAVVFYKLGLELSLIHI